jgi:uncharacterized protein
MERARFVLVILVLETLHYLSLTTEVELHCAGVPLFGNSEGRHRVDHATELRTRDLSTHQWVINNADMAIVVRRHGNKEQNGFRQHIFSGGYMRHRLSSKEKLLAYRDDTSQEIVTSSTAGFEPHQSVPRPSATKAWPPWPFNLLTEKRTRTVRQSHSPHWTQTNLELFGLFAKESTVASLRNMRTIASQLWFHLPPAAPPFIFWAMWPRQVSNHAAVTTAARWADYTGMMQMPSGTIISAAAAKAAANAAESTSIATTTSIVPLFANSWARNSALTFLGLALVSWAHDQVHRTRSLTPLPLAPAYRDINRAILPPFLPDIPAFPSLPMIDLDEQPIGNDLPPPMTDNKIRQEASMLGSTIQSDPDPGWTFTSAEALMTRRMRKHWQQFMSAASPTGFRKKRVNLYLEWLRLRRMEQYEKQREQRRLIFDELVALQALKKQAAARQQLQQSTRFSQWGKWGPSRLLDEGTSLFGYGSKSENKTVASDLPSNQDIGYALVTGASRGIGRALAVQLARWEIPLILVARDADRLTALAYDLEACYGVQCCVLPADLSVPGTAEMIHRATSDAGLKVDILVNNAGCSMQGLSVDHPMTELNNMIQLNALSVSSLSHLYGRDMKERQRGRILMVSSVCGAIAGLPTVAVYSATKAFENTLALSMAQELESYGVGVTCLLPGAVRETAFRYQSGPSEALCWKIPFYPITPYQVARAGIRALLRGDTECTPGWQNRVFLKVLKPALPQRLHNILAETAWSPTPTLFRRPSARGERIDVSPRGLQPVEPQHSRPYAWMPDHYANLQAPRLLQLEDATNSDSTLAETINSESEVLDTDSHPELEHDILRSNVQVPDTDELKSQNSVQASESPEFADATDAPQHLTNRDELNKNAL